MKKTAHINITDTFTHRSQLSSEYKWNKNEDDSSTQARKNNNIVQRRKCTQFIYFCTSIVLCWLRFCPLSKIINLTQHTNFYTNKLKAKERDGRKIGKNNNGKNAKTA